MKRALLILVAVVSMTGCAVRAGYYRDPYWRDHDGYRYHWHDHDDR